MRSEQHKPYDSALKAKHDKPGKQAVIDIMRSFGIPLLRVNNKEDAGNFSEGFWDLKFLMRDKKILTAEAEEKDAKWWGPDFSYTRPFQFRMIDFLDRKKKNKSQLFFLSSTDGDYAFMITRATLDKYGTPKTKPTKRMPRGEAFITIHVKYGRFLQKGEDGKWRYWVPTHTEDSE